MVRVPWETNRFCACKNKAKPNRHKAIIERGSRGIGGIQRPMSYPYLIWSTQIREVFLVTKRPTLKRNV